MESRTLLLITNLGSYGRVRLGSQADSEICGAVKLTGRQTASACRRPGGQTSWQPFSCLPAQPAPVSLTLLTTSHSLHCKENDSMVPISSTERVSLRASRSRGGRWDEITSRRYSALPSVPRSGSIAGLQRPPNVLLLYLLWNWKVFL